MEGLQCEIKGPNAETIHTDMPASLGGGTLAGQILSCMEAAINRTAKEISLAQALELEEIAVYGKRATGAKYLLGARTVRPAVSAVS